MELIWIQNWLVYYVNLVQQSDPFSAWGLNILILIFHYPGSFLPSPLCLQGGSDNNYLITIPRPPPIVIDFP